MTKPLCIVTGGTSGIGFAIARELSAEYDLALVYHSNHERAEAAVKGLQSLRSGMKVKAFAGHLGKVDEAQRIFSEIESWDQRVASALINSAGRSHRSFLVTDLPQDAEELFAANFFSTVNAAHFVGRQMYGVRRGRIVNIGSVSSDGGTPGYALYAASKAAVETFTRNCAPELFPRGITLNCVRPGLVKTAMTADLFKAENLHEKMVPMAAVVAKICFFLSEAAAGLTGQVATVDGGAAGRTD